MTTTDEFREVLEQGLRSLVELQNHGRVVDDYAYHCLLFAGSFGPIPNYPKWSDYLGVKCADVVEEDKNPATTKCVAKVTNLIHAIEYGAIAENDVNELRRIFDGFKAEIG
jgi:hypothetical protein